MISTLGLLAPLSAALFAGAALQWAPSYKRATWLQAPLAIVCLLCGVGVWLLGGSIGWLLAALLVRWGQLHAVRTILSLAGTVIFLWLLLGA